MGGWCEGGKGGHGSDAQSQAPNQQPWRQGGNDMSQKGGRSQPHSPWGQSWDQGQANQQWKQPEWNQQQSWSEQPQQWDQAVASHTVASHTVASSAPAVVREGPPEKLIVAGCQHPTISGIVNGEFVLSSENHGKPVYKKLADDSDVMLYFWDERDSPVFCGWWFGPQVGGDQVWSFHPDKAQIPPSTGWKVPCNGPEDPTMVIKDATAAADTGFAQAMQQWDAPDATATQDWNNQNAEAQRSHNQAANQWQQQAQLQQIRRQQELEQKRREMEKQRAQMEQAKQLQEAQKNKWEEQRAKIVELRQRQEEVRQQRVEEAKLKRDAEMKKREEELKTKREAEESKRKEQQAMLAIRKAMAKVRVATPDDLDVAELELQTVLLRELGNSGTHQEKLREESTKVIDAAKQRVGTILEARRKEQERKDALERKKQEQLEHVLNLIQELMEYVDVAENSAKAAAEANQPLENAKGDSDLTVGEVEHIATVAAAAGKYAKAKVKVCTDFIIAKRKEFQDAKTAEPQADGSPSPKETLGKLLNRINEMTRTIDSNISQIQSKRAIAVKRALARDQTKDLEMTFQKYDADQDDMLSQKEVIRYAKEEYDIDLEQAVLDRIWKFHAEDGELGIRSVNFYWLRTAIGAVRELARDSGRRYEREEKARVIEEFRAQLMEKVQEATGHVDVAETTVVKAEDAVKDMHAKAMKTCPSEHVAVADETDAVAQMAWDAYDSVRQTFEGITSDFNPKYQMDVKELLAQEAKTFESRMGRMKLRLGRVANLTMRLRDEAAQKQEKKISQTREQIFKVARYNQKVKSLTRDELFDVIDSSGDGVIDLAEMSIFLEGAEKTIKELPYREGGQELAEEAGTEDNANAEDNGKDIPSKSSGAAPEVIDITNEMIESAFPSLVDDEDATTISRQTFKRRMTQCYKVVKETTITTNHAVKDAKLLRKLGLNEVVEIIDGPYKEEACKVIRVKIIALRDGAEGWATICSNLGTPFLKEGKPLFRVVKETIMTEAFLLDDETDKGTKVPDDTRKIKVGEIVRVLEWPLRDEVSALTRMKCKLENGSIGWITTTGNQGAVFAEMLEV